MQKSLLAALGCATVPSMGNQISIRMEPELAERAERLADQLAVRPEFRAFRLTRASVLRMAMLEGLDEMERRILPDGSAE